MSSHDISHEMPHGVSAHTADLYDRATSATASREPISDKGRRKRPAFLALHNEDRDNAYETARYVQTRKEKEQLRRSSPTVGEGFEFRAAPEMSRAMPVQPVDARNEHRVEGPADSVMGREDDAEDEHEDNDDDNYDAEDEDLEQHLDDPPAPPSSLELPLPSGPDRLDPITEEISPKPKRQKSSSSVRSQIIALPETARLRKQASGELARLQREQMPTPTPSLPSLRTFQGLNKAASEELLSRPRTSERNQKYTVSDTTQLAVRPRRGPSKRVSRDAGPHPNVPLPPTPLENHFGIAVSSLSRTPTPMSPNGAQPSEDAWPLTPEVCNMPPPPFSPTHSRAASQQEPSFPAQRSISPESVVTLRPSRSNTPQFSNSSAPYGPLPPTSTATTPRKGRSRSNTSATLSEDALYAAAFDDGASIAASSVAPSTMSAQWYRTPRERLGLGSRIRAEHVPWEQLDHQVAADDDERARSRKVQLFTIYPPRSPTSPLEAGAASAAAAAAQQGQAAAHAAHAAHLAQLAEMSQQQPPQYQPYPQHNHSSSHSNAQLLQLQQLQQAQLQAAQAAPRENVPPRSPLLTDKFLTGVRTLPEDPPRQVSAIPPPTPVPVPVPVPARTLSLRTLSRRNRRNASAEEDGETKKSSKKSEDGGGGGSRSTSGSRMGGRFPTLGELVTEYKSMAHRFYTAGSSSSRDDDRGRATPRRRPAAPAPGVFGGSSTMLDAAPPPTEARMRELQAALHRGESRDGGGGHPHHHYHRRNGSSAAAATTNGTTTPATATPKSDRHGRSQSTSNLSILLRSASRSARASRAASAAAAKAASAAARDAEIAASVPPSRAGSATPNGLLDAAAAAVQTPTPTPKRKERKTSFFRRRGDADEGVDGSAKKGWRARSRSGA
jgi:hypothetical protein